jgi:hypothetical protein
MAPLTHDFDCKPGELVGRNFLRGAGGLLGDELEIVAVRDVRCISLGIRRYHRIDLDFDKPVGIDEPSHLNNRVHRPDLLEELAVHIGYGFPIRNAGEQESGANYIVQARSKFFQSCARDFEAASRLRGGIAHSDRFAVWTEWSGAADCDHVTDANCAREANDGLEGTA